MRKPNQQPTERAGTFPENHSTATDLPELRWQVVRIGDLVATGSLLMQNGYAQGAHNDTGHGVPHLRPFNVTSDGRIDLTQIKYIAAPPADGPYWVHAGDVIFNNTNSEELVGKTAYFGHDGRFLLSNHMTIIRVLDPGAVDAFWLAKELQFLFEKGLFRSLCRRHVNQASVSLERLKGIEIPLPELPEQRAIAHVLSTVQRAIEATEKVIAATRELKRSLMRHLFTYGPVPLQEAERVPLGHSPFGQMPQHWRVLPLDACAHVQTGAAKGRQLKGQDTISVPYLRVANVQDGYLDLSEIKTLPILKSELQRYQLQPGDVLLTEGGDFDKLGRGFIWTGQIRNCIHQNHIFAVRANRSILLPRYLAYLIQSDYGKAYFLSVAHRTTHLACINSTKLKAFPVLVPELAEQEQIVSVLESADRKLEAEEQRQAALENLFRSLLQHLMTGKVRVDPSIAP